MPKKPCAGPTASSSAVFASWNRSPAHRAGRWSPSAPPNGNSCGWRPRSVKPVRGAEEPQPHSVIIHGLFYIVGPSRIFTATGPRSDEPAGHEGAGRTSVLCPHRFSNIRMSRRGKLEARLSSLAHGNHGNPAHLPFPSVARGRGGHGLCPCFGRHPFVVVGTIDYNPPARASRGRRGG